MVSGDVDSEGRLKLGKIKVRRSHKGKKKRRRRKRKRKGGGERVAATPRPEPTAEPEALDPFDDLDALLTVEDS